MSTKRLILDAVVLVCGAALVVSACGSDGSNQAGDVAVTTGATGSQTPEPVTSEPEGSGVEANGEVVDVVALDNTFRPDTIQIVAGTAIRWENRGRNDHDVVPADESPDWGVGVTEFAPGDEYTLVFDTPGEYPYFCSIHGTKDVGMVGTVVVLAADE